jgi:hypothetical protein
VSTTPAITLSPVATTPVNKQLIASVNYTGEKHKAANISANFLKNAQWPQWDTQGPGGNRFMKKNLN